MISSTIWILATFSMGMASGAEYDEYGGWTMIKGERTGYFHAERIDRVWWLIDPLGNGFISKGVNHISYTADNSPALGYAPYGRVTEKKYGDAETWANQAVKNLWQWGFNTVGAWSHGETFNKGMPYTLILGLGSATGADWQAGRFPDVFSDVFREAVEEKAKRICAPIADDPYLLGYFTDNELRWGPDWRSSDTLFDDFLAMPEDMAGKKALVDMLGDTYGSIRKMNEALDIDCLSFDDVLSVTDLAGLGVEMFVDKPAPTKTLKLPKDLALMYLRQTHGDINKANAALGTDAKSFDDLLTPEFLSRLTEDMKSRMPKNVAVMGLRMFYTNLERANAAFEADSDSFEELVDMFFGRKTLTPAGEEIVKLKSKFLEIVSRQYFSVCHDAIRKADPNHLILGCRFAGYAPIEVLWGMKGYVDVISYNNYDKSAPRKKLAEIYGIVERPMMLTEFSFKAMDSGLPNTRGAGVPVETQEDRARYFEEYVTGLMELPYAVGYHWFEYCDEPAEGRFDGENSNYGLVNIKDEPWEVLTQKMTQVNRKMETIHKGD